MEDKRVFVKYTFPDLIRGMPGAEPGLDPGMSAATLATTRATGLRRWRPGEDLRRRRTERIHVRIDSRDAQDLVLEPAMEWLLRIGVCLCRRNDVLDLGDNDDLRSEGTRLEMPSLALDTV